MPPKQTSPTEHRGKGRPRAFDRDQALHRALEVFWRRGYEPASVAELCQAMGINPPSLYATFGNKSSLFLEAVRYYERTYWDAPAKRFLAEPDLYRAVGNFFSESAQILLSPDTPCGCMVILKEVLSRKLFFRADTKVYLTGSNPFALPAAKIGEYIRVLRRHFPLFAELSMQSRMTTSAKKARRNCASCANRV